MEILGPMNQRQKFQEYRGDEKSTADDQNVK